MTRWFTLQPADEQFIETAPLRFVHVVDIDGDVAALWQALTVDDALEAWAMGITGAQWTSPRPFGVGTTRTVTVAKGGAALQERFFRWEDGRRMTFYATAASRPGFRKFAEDVLVEPRPGGARLTWTFAIEAASWTAPVLNASRPLLDRVTRAWAMGVAGEKGLGRTARYVSKEGARR
ncbi:MAG: SRPBCC family protein [Rhodococcus sp.]|nr:SRPBCC family protein [Rhodococcus sp. (in: high G+C Gram-positive bacteria)]